MRPIFVTKMYSFKLLCVIFIFSFIFVYFVYATESYFGKNDDVCVGQRCASKNPEQTPQGNAPPHVLEDQRRDQRVNVMFTFVNGAKNAKLTRKFRTTVESLLKYCTKPLLIRIIGEKKSYIAAEKIVKELSDGKDIEVCKKLR